MIGDWILPERAAPQGGETVAAATPAEAAVAPAPPPVADIRPLLAKANVDKGKRLFRQCEICHTAKKGADAKMAFPGFKKVGDRVDVIAYLRPLNDSTPPLP